MRNYSYTHLDMFDKGYRSIPVRTDGVPLVDKFLQRDFSPDEIETWCHKFPDATVALVCCNGVYALDFDIDDPEVSMKMQEFIQTNISKHLPIRKKVGQGCTRFATVFRGDESLKEVKNGSSYKYKHNGEKNQVELIGNRLISIDGEHRKSGAIYHWDYPLWKIMRDDLPILSLKHVETVFNKYRELMTATDADVLRSRDAFTYFRENKEVTGNAFDDITLTKKYSDGEIDEYLESWNGDTREDWVKVGMALHNHFQGSVEGFRRWDEWSAQFEGYEGTEDCRTQWKSFHSDGGITMGTVEHVAKKKKNVGIEKKSNETPMEFALNNYVLIASTNEVGDLSKPINESLLPLQNMKNLKSNIKVPIEVHEGNNVKIKNVQLVKAWLDHQDRLNAYSIEYVPNGKRLIEGHEFKGGYRTQLYYNRYVPPHVDYTEDTDLLEYFLEHINYMFESDPQWVLNWLAQIVQEPSKRYRTILYSIATHTGTGRGWLAKLLSYIYGETNVKTVGSMAKIADPNAKNGYLDGSVLLIVNETDAPGKMKYNVGDRLKSMVSDDRQEVDIKYGKQSFNQQVYTRVFLQSNAIGNLVIEQNDNRIQPFINMNPPKDKDYYTRLYGLLDNPRFINQVYSYLSRFKVVPSKLQAAHMSEEKKIVISANTSATASAFYEFLSIVGNNCFTTRQLNQCLSQRFVSGDTFDEDGVQVNKAELRHLMGDNVPFKEHIVLNKQQVRVYSAEIGAKTTWDKSKIKRSINTTQTLINQHYEV